MLHHLIAWLVFESSPIQGLCRVMPPLNVQNHALRIQCTYVSWGCNQDAVEHLNRFVRALLAHQGICKSYRRINIVRVLLHLIPQSPLLNILTNFAQNAFAHSRIDLIGAEQLGGRCLLHGKSRLLPAGATAQRQNGEYGKKK
ncbi:hypothetical protein A4R28_21165 [Mesorhizobium ciceri]|nr:hypothetical protein A4R28_21165 [Mesorhizobium ciceri]